MNNNQWAQAIDPVSGRLYYFNQSTGETSWTPPPPPDTATQQTFVRQAAAHDAIPSAAPLQQQQQHTQPLTAQQNTTNSALHSSVTYQLDASTATTPGLLVPSVRAIIEKEQAQKTSIRKIELEGVSAGTIADLCNVTREWRSRNLHVDGGDFATEKHAAPHDQNESQNANENDEAANHYYRPLQPFSLPLQSRPPHVEPGRVDIRMHALYGKLRSLGEENIS
jgi:hypothetical protein